MVIVKGSIYRTSLSSDINIIDKVFLSPISYNYIEFILNIIKLILYKDFDSIKLKFVQILILRYQNFCEGQ